MEIALHIIFLVVHIVCTCPTAWGIGDLHQTAAVEEEPCPSTLGSMSSGAVELVEAETFGRHKFLCTSLTCRALLIAFVVVDPASLACKREVLLRFARGNNFKQKVRQTDRQTPLRPGHPQDLFPPSGGQGVKS